MNIKFALRTERPGQNSIAATRSHSPKKGLLRLFSWLFPSKLGIVFPAALEWNQESSSDPAPPPGSPVTRHTSKARSRDLPKGPTLRGQHHLFAATFYDHDFIWLVPQPSCLFTTRATCSVGPQREGRIKHGLCCGPLSVFPACHNWFKSGRAVNGGHLLEP